MNKLRERERDEIVKGLSQGFGERLSGGEIYTKREEYGQTEKERGVKQGILTQGAGSVQFASSLR